MSPELRFTRSNHPRRQRCVAPLLMVLALLLAALMLLGAGSPASLTSQQANLLPPPSPGPPHSPSLGKGGDKTSPPAAKADVPPVMAGPFVAVPAGMIAHTVQRGESMASLVHLYLPQTSYLLASQLDAAIRQSNGNRKGNNLKPGETVLIPGFEPAFVEKPVPLPADFEVRAIYLTGIMAGSAKGLELARQWRQLGGNSVVFDIKDSDGGISVPFQHRLAPATHPPIRNLPKFVRYLHSMDMHVIARIAIFRDEALVQRHPELAVRSRLGSAPWRENGKLVWTDPSRPEVQEYNIALAKYAAQSGVDEIQFDYVRFPAEGDQKDAQFFFESSPAHPKEPTRRSDVIAGFLASAYRELHPMNVLLSLDVFGVMAWQRPVDLAHTGQDIVAMAKHCDVLSPMIYPSHFFGMDGYRDPGDAPEHFISESMDRFRMVTKDSPVVLRPWLQAFAWRTKSYSPEYIRTQVMVARQNGGIGFLFWNARNDYSKAFAAMPGMRTASGHFFRGDEIRSVRPRQVAVSQSPQRAIPAKQKTASKM